MNRIKGNDEVVPDSQINSNVPYRAAPIDKWGYYGRWFRHKLLDGILVGTPVLVTIQRHRTPTRTNIMKFFSFLGTEDFYTVLFLFLYWMVDARLGRLFGVLLPVGFYTTGSLKTLLCLPRPPSPPIQPLEKAYDWALPSHHSLLGVICPWYLWLYVNIHFQLSPFQTGIVCCGIVVWSFGVMLSRLYLGVHSPADIVCGGIVGVLVLSMWMQVDDFLDFYISQRIELQYKLFLSVIILLLIHPSSEKGNPSYPDTCTCMGVLFGIIFARTRQRTRGYPALLEVSPHITVTWFFLHSVVRVLVGILAVVISKLISKAIARTILLQIFNRCGVSSYSSKQYGATYPLSKHYSKQFVLPPVYQKPDIEDLKSDGSGDDLEKETDSEKSTTKSTEAAKIDETNDTKLTMGQLTSWFLPPNYISSFKEDWNIDIPLNMVVYTIMTFVGLDLAPQIFIHLSI